MSEIYISVDIEADGPIPGPHSMLSLGAAAFLKVPVPDTYEFMDQGTFSANFETLEGASGDPDTMNWWKGQPAAWEACREDLQEPLKVMQNFSSWIGSFGKKPVFVGYPAGFDFLFVYWYFIKFLGPGKSPFSFSALDIKSYASAVMDCDFRDVTKRSMKKYLPPDRPHTHVAIDDAIEQGELFCNLKKANRLLHKK